MQLVEIERERQPGTNNGTDMRKKGECREGCESLEKISPMPCPTLEGSPKTREAGFGSSRLGNSS